MRIDDILENIPPHIRNQVEDLIKQYIQESKQVERQLGRSEQKYRDLISNLSDVVVETDLEGNFTFASPQAVDLLGYRPEEVIGRSGFDFVHPDDQVCAMESMEKAMSGSHVFNFEYRVKHKEGHYVWLSASGRFVGENTERRLILVIKDISERKQVEDTLRKEELQYLSILESMGDAIHVVNRDLKFKFLNSTFKRWNKELGLETEVIAHRIDDIFPFLSKKVIDEYHQVFTTRKPLITEESTWINEKEFITETRKIPLLDGNEVIQVVTIIRDITERKLAEEEIKRTKNERERILNSLIEHVVYQNTDHQILWANQAACDSVDETLDQLIGKFCYQVWNKRSEPCIDCPVAKALQAEKPQENEVTTPDGRVWFIQGVPVFGTNGEITGAVETTLEITERKSVEESLRESKEKYQMLVEKLREGVLLEDTEGIISFVNPQTVKMLGYSEDDLIGRHYSFLVPEEELDKVTTEASKRPKGISSTYESSLITKENNRVPVIITATSLFSIGGKFNGVLSVFTDITERKLAEEALRESKEKYQMLIEKMEEAVLLEDAGGKIRFVNPKMTSMLGYIEDELLGQHYTFVVPPEFYDQTDSETKKRPLGVSSTYESAVLAKDGRSIPVLVSASPIFSITGEFEGVLSVATDITKRKQAKEALQRSEERYRKLVELSPDAITLTDLNANIIMVNQQTASLYGYEKDELIGKNSFELVAPDDQQRAINGLQNTLKLGIVRNDEYELVKKDGSLFTAEINVEFLTDDEGNPTGFIAVTRDITERIKAREERIKLEKMRREFMDQAAHELRTPLTIIKGYTEFLQMRETNEENHRILNTIMNNVMRLEELGTTVSDIYRIERGKFEVILEKMEFHVFLKNFLDPYLELYEGQFHFNDVGLKDQLLINGDSKRLKNVLSNVLDNAIRNTAIETRDITLDLVVTRDLVEIVIKDNGAGIKPENLEKIFEKFTSFPTKYDITGTGIGLYIAREIVNAHNGSISAYSEGEDKGTTIRIKLPRING